MDMTPLTDEAVAEFIAEHPGLNEHDLLGALGYRNCDSNFGPDWPRLNEVLKTLRGNGRAHTRLELRPDHPGYPRLGWYPGERQVERAE